jgi:dTDP-glucose 4,6-dehydratase
VKTALVAGAAGFLGSNLCKALIAKDYKVLGVDNFATSSQKNLGPLLEVPNFSFLEASVTENSALDKTGAVDYVYHLASPASPPKYQKLGLETIRVNTIGTENLTEFALKHSARFLFASTSEIYGDPLVSPQPEKYWGNVNPIGPRSVYDEAKRLGETLVSHFVREEGLNGAIIRIFNTYGPGMDPFDGRVVSTFIRQVLQGEPMTVFGDGTQTRSFCYVDDLIRGIILMAESDQFGPINLGNPIEIDLLSLGQTVAKVLGVAPRFQHLDLPEDDPKQRNPDITRAKELLNWNPSVTLEEGIRKTATWMRDIERIG